MLACLRLRSGNSFSSGAVLTMRGIVFPPAAAVTAACGRGCCWTHSAWAARECLEDVQDGGMWLWQVLDADMDVAFRCDP